MTKNILLVGVGGQGTILASKLLTTGLTQAGYDVKMSEIHGMSQRGGSVSSQVRYGEKVYSPVIERGSADVIVAFEKMEALRWTDYLKQDGKVIVNNYRINPMPVISGVAEYDPDILEKISEKTKAYIIDAQQEAQKLGFPKVMNVILLGSTVKLMSLEDLDWKTVIRDNIKPKFVDMNIEAFEIGKSLV